MVGQQLMRQLLLLIIVLHIPQNHSIGKAKKLFSMILDIHLLILTQTSKLIYQLSLNGKVLLQLHILSQHANTLIKMINFLKIYYHKITKPLVTKLLYWLMHKHHILLLLLWSNGLMSLLANRERCLLYIHQLMLLCSMVLH